MLLIFLEYVFDLCFFAVAVYLALLVMEKIGKKRPGTWRDRAPVAIVLAAGASMMQMVVHAIALVYSGGFHAGP